MLANGKSNELFSNYRHSRSRSRVREEGLEDRVGLYAMWVTSPTDRAYSILSCTANLALSRFCVQDAAAADDLELMIKPLEK